MLVCRTSASGTLPDEFLRELMFPLLLLPSACRRHSLNHRRDPRAYPRAIAGRAYPGAFRRGDARAYPRGDVGAYPGAYSPRGDTRA